jgi:hypothetical protein
MKRVVWVAGLLTALIVVLVPMAWASPIDPSWIKGVYDDADFDDVVTYLTSFLIAAPVVPLHDVLPMLVVVRADLLVDPKFPSVQPVTPHSPRAPPQH